MVYNMSLNKTREEKKLWKRVFKKIYM